MRVVELKTRVSKHTAKVRYSLMFRLIRLITPALEVRESLPRPMVRFLHERFADKPLIGVEIGVATGLHAENILETLNIQKLFLIDPYTPYMGLNRRGANKWTDSYTKAFPKAQKRLSKFVDRITFILKTSTDALSDIPDNLDFVYIDGNHTYSYVKNDIEHYYPKVKDGGVLGGHDFILGSREGLVKAVVEFALKHNIKLYGGKSRLYCDWWLIKRELTSLQK